MISLKKSRGVALLAITLILLICAALITAYSTSNSLSKAQNNGDLLDNNQSFYAAQAGIEYGIAWLTNNTSTVTASASGGYVNYGASNSALTNVTLANGTKYSIVYTNPTQNNYSTINIQATGVTTDGTSTTVIQQRVYLVSNSPSSTVVSGGNISMVGGSVLTNTLTNININSGGALTINNGAYTVTTAGQMTYQNHIAADVIQNATALQGLSEPQFFQVIFGSPKATVLSAVQSTGIYYNNTVAGGDYSSKLSGVTGKTIWIDQTNGSTVTLGSGVTVGSLLSPVTLIVQGNLTIANGVTINGFVYSSAPSSMTLAGGAKILGAMAAAGPINISNGFLMTYVGVPTLVGASAAGSYAKIPGSWTDF